VFQVLLVGVDYRTAAIDCRERLAAVAGCELLLDLQRRTGLSDLLVLSTCNRFEVYGAIQGDVDSAVDRLTAVLGERLGHGQDSPSAGIYVRHGEQAVRHLFSVVAGRESMVQGETQIVAQFRRAMLHAREHGTLGPILDRLSASAIAASRRIRAQVARQSPAFRHSMASRAVDCVISELAGGNGRVTVIGAGEVAEDVLSRLRTRGIGKNRLTVVNRSADRAGKVAQRFGVESAEWSELPALLAASRVVFCCTSTSTPIIDGTLFAESGRSPVMLVDLGMPRNVSRDVLSLADISIIDVDDLRTRVVPARAGDNVAIHTQLDEAARRFHLWLQRRRIVPTLAMICANAESLRTSELSRIRNRLGNLDEHQFGIIESMSRRLVGQLLHRPLATLAASPDSDELTRSARRLFDSHQ